MLPASGERASPPIQRAGQDSHFVDALAARIVWCGQAARGPALRVRGRGRRWSDADSLAALTQIADEAAGRLQKERNSAIRQG